MRKKNYALKVVAVFSASMICLSGCGGAGSSSNETTPSVNPDIIEGTWETVEVGVDGSTFTFEELDAMGETSVEETTIIFKEGGKAIVVVPEDDYSTMYDWEETSEGEWTMSDDWEEFDFTKEEERLVMTYDDYGTEITLYFEKATDDQTVPTIAEEEEEMEEDESEEPKKGSKKESKKEPEEETQKEESSENTSEPVDFYAAMDEYEIFFDEYIAFMEEYNESDDPTIYMDDYADFMNQYAKTMEAMTNIDMGSLTNEELAYYTEVTTRIYGKLAESGM